MSWLFAALALAVFVYSFRLKELPILTNIGLFIGCILLVLSVVSIKAGKGHDECWIEWDSRSNSTICD